MSFMCPKEDELLRDFFSNKIRNPGMLQCVVFLNQVKCYVFLFFLLSWHPLQKLSFDLDYYCTITANTLTSADKTIITLSGNGVSWNLSYKMCPFQNTLRLGILKLLKSKQVEYIFGKWKADDNMIPGSWFIFIWPFLEKNAYALPARILPMLGYVSVVWGNYKKIYMINNAKYLYNHLTYMWFSINDNLGLRAIFLFSLN